MCPGPAVHSDLATLVPFPCRTSTAPAVGVEVGLVEHKRFADPQPGAPEHYDHAAQPKAVGTVSGSADDGDDLFHGRRFGWVPTTLIAWWNALLEAGGGRGRAAPASAVQQRYRFHDVLLWTMVDATIVPAQLASGQTDPVASPTSQSQSWLRDIAPFDRAAPNVAIAIMGRASP